MIKIKNFLISEINFENKVINAVYYNTQLIWEKIKEDINKIISCFSSGKWKDEYKWLDYLKWSDDGK